MIVPIPSIRSNDGQIVVVTSFKGGSGKSTAVTNVAVAAVLAGLRTLVIDADPQRSLSFWLGLRRPGLGAELTGIASAPRDAAALADRSRAGFDLILVDMPGRDDAAVTAVMREASFCLVPARPSALDADASQRTVDALERMGVRYGVLLTQVQAAATVRTRAWVEIYDSRSLVVAPVWVSRVAYQDAVAQGLGVMELAPASLAAQEVWQAWLWIAARLRLAGKADV